MPNNGLTWVFAIFYVILLPFSANIARSSKYASSAVIVFRLFKNVLMACVMHEAQCSSCLVDAGYFSKIKWGIFFGDSVFMKIE